MVGIVVVNFASCDSSVSMRLFWSVLCSVLVLCRSGHGCEMCPLLATTESTADSKNYRLAQTANFIAIIGDFSMGQREDCGDTFSMLCINQH